MKEVLSASEARRAVRMIFKVAGGVTYSEKTKSFRRLKWVIWEDQKRNIASGDLAVVGIDHVTASRRGCYPHITIRVPIDFDVREATKGLKNPNAPKPKPKLPKNHLYDWQKDELLRKLRPYVNGDDINLSTIELIQVIHDRIKEDLS